jgi:hypothetical protein
MWLGPEGKTHAGDIAHGITQRIVAFKRRVGVDVSMNFKVNSIPVEQRAEFVSHLNTFAHFGKHPLLNAHPPVGYFTADKHKATLSLSYENDDRSELGNITFHLAIGSNAYFQGMPSGGFCLQNHPDFAGYRAMDAPAIQPSPLSLSHGFAIYCHEP